MNKTRMIMKMMLGTFVLGSIVLMGGGCATQADDEGGAGADEGPVAQVESAYASGTVACVDQSYASAEQVPAYWMTCRPPLYTTRLSHGHKVRIKVHVCDTPYVDVQSFWTGSWYRMREDALRPC